MTLRRADNSSGGVLPIVLRRFVFYRNLVNEEALAHWGTSRRKQANIPLRLQHIRIYLLKGIVWKS